MLLPLLLNSAIGAESAKSCMMKDRIRAKNSSPTVQIMDYWTTMFCMVWQMSKRPLYIQEGPEIGRRSHDSGVRLRDQSLTNSFLFLMTTPSSLPRLTSSIPIGSPSIWGLKLEYWLERYLCLASRSHSLMLEYWHRSLLDLCGFITAVIASSASTLLAPSAQGAHVFALILFLADCDIIMAPVSTWRACPWTRAPYPRLFS